MSFFQSSFLTTLSSAGTALISLSFAISTTCQEFLGSIIFLFVKHPYDVGDRVDISSESLIVEKISLLYTVFTDLKSMQITQVPNIVLNNLWIDNLTRSKAMKEVVEVNISYDTSFEDVELLRLEMEKFVRHPDNARDFQQDLVIGIGSVGDCDKLTLKIVMKHKSNWHNEAVRATRRSKFMCALALALKKVPIFGPGGGADPVLGSSDNPTYSVAVGDSFASVAREKALKEADAVRMVPKMQHKPSTKRTDTSDTTGHVKHVSEKQAVEELNMRSAAATMEANFGYNRDENDLERPAENQTEASPSPATQQRAENIEQIRADLLKRDNTRGRRRAGEGVPAAALGETPGLAVTHYDSHGNQIVTTHSNRQMSYDVIPEGSESQPPSGMGSPYGGAVSGAYGPLTSQVSPRVAEAARESYSLYEGQDYPGLGHDQQMYGQTGAHSYGRELTPGTAITTTAPSESLRPTAHGSAPHGARQRGASVSRVMEEREAETRAGSSGTSARKQYTK